ncbi:protein YebF [Serratia quinivorans]|uniref:protein YebF n=1 Tax=Serratia quinivorans TaxID=137545 RepID=UPI0034C6C278
MKTTGLSLAVALLAMAGLTTSVQAQEQRSAKVAQCAGLQPADVAAQVKRDFLQNRITRWESDKKLLGTATPIAWISPEAITGKDAVWQVPLTVRGTKQDKTYHVTLDCNAGKITYSEPQ